MIDRLSRIDLEEAREGAFYQALLAEIVIRQRAAMDRMVSLGSNGQEAGRMFAMAGRAAALEELHKMLETTQGRDD